MEKFKIWLFCKIFLIIRKLLDDKGMLYGYFEGAKANCIISNIKGREKFLHYLN